MSRVDAAGRDVRADADRQAAALPSRDDLALLASIDAGKVVDNDAALPLLRADGALVAVAERVWAMYRAGWVHQLEGERGWRLTWRGRDVMQGRLS